VASFLAANAHLQTVATMSDDELKTIIEIETLRTKLLEQSAPSMIEAGPVEAVEAKSDERKDEK
jgi:hypothetical protein